MTNSRNKVWVQLAAIGVNGQEISRAHLAAIGVLTNMALQMEQYGTEKILISAARLLQIDSWLHGSNSLVSASHVSPI